MSTVVSSSSLSITKGNIVHRLTARALIRDWDDACLSDKPTEHAALQREAKDAIISLSTSYSLVSQYTSFVAIEKREKDEEATGTDWMRLIQKENIDRLVNQAFDLYITKEGQVSDHFEPPAPPPMPPQLFQAQASVLNYSLFGASFDLDDEAEECDGGVPVVMDVGHFTVKVSPTYTLSYLHPRLVSRINRSRRSFQRWSAAPATQALW
jgi:hypothetical protein